MKTLKPFALGAITICMIQACKEPKTNSMEDKYSAGSYELNVDGRNDTINMIYADGSKEGHWIIKVWTAETGRIKTAEGYYKDNKKEGYWKFFNKDGSLKDSVEYKNDVAISK